MKPYEHASEAAMAALFGDLGIDPQDVVRAERERDEDDGPFMLEDDDAPDAGVRAAALDPVDQDA